MHWLLQVTATHLRLQFALCWKFASFMKWVVIANRQKAFSNLERLDRETLSIKRTWYVIVRNFVICPNQPHISLVGFSGAISAGGVRHYCGIGYDWEQLEKCKAIGWGRMGCDEVGKNVNRVWCVKFFAVCRKMGNNANKLGRWCERWVRVIETGGWFECDFFKGRDALNLIIA